MIYEITVPQFTKMLKNLDAILVKATAFAEAKKIEFDVLLNSRLAPDQFNLLRQIQIATDTAKIGVAKLTGKDAPVHDDKETTVAQLRTRIAETIAFLATVTEKDFAGAHERKITTPRWENKYLLGHEYLIQHTVPNLYFHISVAYEILRHNGLDIGKKDYLGAMPFRT
ncbi:MAG: DUF1993 domain-containing protein [Bdellovibrionaceae bacterium]|nr:DUF1993 domain-containing protein [Pseudobdellovibrionaceae bacterium]